MTRYKVIWRQSAMNHLATIWTNAVDRDRVSAASDAIDVELAEDAATKGRPIGKLFRRLMIGPLDVLFAVVEKELQVHVLAVRRVSVPTNGRPRGPIP